MKTKNYTAYVGKEKLFGFEAHDPSAAIKKAKRIHAQVTHVNTPIEKPKQ